ncbi:MAG: heavy-metal-associated domain-containing protein [Planctomycetota bacterium]
MRSIVYGLAILAAAGIMYFISTSNSATENQTADTAAVDSDVDVQTASMTLSVPDMHCPFACYPKIKENLEKQDEILTVELAPQSEEGVIDNPQVIVTYKESYDPKSALAVLDSVGFGDGADIVETN